MLPPFLSTMEEAKAAVSKMGTLKFGEDRHILIPTIPVFFFSIPLQSVGFFVLHRLTGQDRYVSQTNPRSWG